MADGAAMAAMCISFGDYDNDGQMDLYVSDFQDVSDHVWRNQGKGFFEEVTDRLAIAAPTRKVLSFGGGFFDYDNDGWVDLFIANGHVYEGVEKTRRGVTYRQINSLFHNEANGKFSEATSAAGEAFTVPRLGRGAAFADLDNDGSVDVVVANSGDRPVLLHNTGGDNNHFVNLKLAGTQSNRDALGARIRLSAGGITQTREIAGGGSYLSQSDLRAHLGIGANARVDRVEITWPSGRKQLLRDLEADSFLIVHEGNDSVEKMPASAPGKGFRRP
jgi:hypothetical protein